MAMHICGHPLLIKTFINLMPIYLEKKLLFVAQRYAMVLLWLLKKYIFIGKMEQNETILCLKCSCNIVFVEWNE